MKRAFLCLMAMCLFSLIGAAQTTPTTNTDKTDKMEKSHHAGMKGEHAGMKGDMSGEKTLTGCVSQESGENEFMLATGGKRNIELETTEDLKPHVGHTVKVTGTWDMAADKSEAKGGADAMGNKSATEAGEHKGMKEHHFKVTKMEMVSETCKMGAGKAKASTKKTTAPGN